MDPIYSTQAALANAVFLNVVPVGNTPPAPVATPKKDTPCEEETPVTETVQEAPVVAEVEAPVAAAAEDPAAIAVAAEVKAPVEDTASTEVISKKEAKTTTSKKKSTSKSK